MDDKIRVRQIAAVHAADDHHQVECLGSRTCLLENQFIWTRRALETKSPDDDGLLFCGQKMTDLEEVMYKKIFSRSELEKGLRRLVKAGLLVKRVDGVALEGSRNVRFYSLSAKEIARLRAEVRADRTDWERKTDALIPPEIEAEQEQEDRAEIPGIVPLEAVLVTPETPVRQPVEPKLEQVRANLPQPALVPGQITLDAMDELDGNTWVMSNPPVKKSQNTPSEKS